MRGHGWVVVDFMMRVRWGTLVCVRGGCGFHGDSESSFCYVKDPNVCTKERSSLHYPHARFKTCTIPQEPFFWKPEDVTVPTIAFIIFALAILTLVCAIGIGFRRCSA